MSVANVREGEDEIEASRAPLTAPPTDFTNCKATGPRTV